MRILLVNDYAGPLGGAEIQTLALREELRGRGHDVRLFASTAGGGEPDYACRGTLSRWRTSLQCANPWARRALRRALAEFRPDVVHVRLYLTQLSPLILPELRRVPSLYHAVWYRAVCPLGTKLLPDGRTCREPAGLACRRNRCLPRRDWAPLMLQRRLTRRWHGVFDRVVAISDAVARRLEEDGLEVTDVLPNGVVARPPRPPLADPPTVAFAGRLTPEKGADVLVRAFAEAAVPGARLLIAGEGPERPRLERLAREAGLDGRVAFLGRVAPAEVEQGLNGAWAQAVPSRWEEPFGNAAAEALARGTALVASENAGAAAFVEDGRSALLVPPGDAGALGAAVRRVLGDRELAERLGRAGQAAVAGPLSRSLFLDRLETIYAELAAAG